MAVAEDNISCGSCGDFYMIPAGCLEDRRPTVVCSKGHVVCAKCAHALRTSRCFFCNGQMLQTTRLDAAGVAAIEKLTNQKSIASTELNLDSKPYTNGAFGDVYQAKWNSREVVVKVVRMTEDLASYRALFEYESKLALDLFHSNVIRQFGTTALADGRFGIVMEYADNGSLDKHWRLMSEEVMVRVSIGIIDGLEYLHLRKVIHRDLKPPNILLHSHEMTPKIADFGLSKIVSTLTKATEMLGTVSYVAPEILDSSVYGFSADIYSLAIILYEMFSRLDAYPGLTAPQVITAVIRNRRPVIPSGFPMPLQPMIERGWMVEPDRRPSLDEFRFVLQATSDANQSPQCSRAGPLSTAAAVATKVVEKSSSETEAEKHARQTISSNSGDVAVTVASQEKTNVVLSGRNSNSVSGLTNEAPNLSINKEQIRKEWDDSYEERNSKQLRHKMILDIQIDTMVSKYVNSSVLSVMEIVQRHRFIPGEWLAEILVGENTSSKRKKKGSLSRVQEWIRRSRSSAYGNTCVVTRQDIIIAAYKHDLSMKFESSPRILATEVSLTGIDSFQSVLLIGYATGYMQAVVSELVGPHGSVTVVDEDESTLTTFRDGFVKEFKLNDVMRWIHVSPLTERNILKTLKAKKKMFHAIIDLESYEKFPIELGELLLPTGKSSLLASVKINENEYRYQLLVSREGKKEIKIFKDIIFKVRVR